MTRITTMILIALSVLLATPAAVADSAMDEVEVGSCLRLVAQEKAPEGLRMVSNDIQTLLLMKEAAYSFTLFAGNAYQLHTCAGANVTDLDAALYDQNGKLLVGLSEVDRQPVILFTPEKTGTYYLVLKLIDTADGKPGSLGYVQLYE
jgi:hypothetical protein